MKHHAALFRLVLAAVMAFKGLAFAQTPPVLTTGVEVSSSNERTSLNRTTGKLSSVVNVKIKNTSDRLLEPPLHAVITFTPVNGGSLTGLNVTGAQGGIGLNPYQTFFKDLTSAINTGLAAGAETTFSFTFERPPTATMSYAVTVRGVRNADPGTSIGGPYSGQQGVPVAFDASGSTDPDNDALSFAWDFGDGTTATGATPQHSFVSAGLYTVTVTATDARGASAFRETQVPIAPPGAFALARTRTLDDNGHPLGSVTISQTGPDGTRTFQSDEVSGFSSLGGAPGDHTWSFASAGHLTSFRKATLSQGQVKVVSFPWLAALSINRTTLSLLNPTQVKSPAERVTLTMPTGAFEQVESVAITDLHGQSLPLPLPFGWSPLAAFHLDMPGESAADVAASVELLQAVTPAQTVVLARLDTASAIWKAESLLTGPGSDTVTAVLRKPGSYAVVIADTLPSGNPATAQAGQPLPVGTAPAVAADVTVLGTVSPATNVASLDPAKVTATATVNFTNNTQPLASGAWFLAEVEETYDLLDGQALKTPDYDATFYAYQHPGDTVAATATATFPLRPRVLFGPDELTEANVKVGVLALNQFGGGILSQDGGVLSQAGVQVGVPAGAVSGPAAAEIRLLSTVNLSRFLGGFPALMAFELNLPALANGTALSFTVSQKLAPTSDFVLARCVSTGSETGLQPVQRLHSNAQGTITSAEPASGPRLPGLTGSGQYVIVQITEPEALITGLVRKVGGALLPGALVRVAAEPWLSLTSSAGTFSIIAKPGTRIVTGTDPADGNSGQATATLANAVATANVEIQTAPTGPRVVATTPVANDTKASIVAPITVEFSEPILPGSFGANGIHLRDVAANTDVPGSLSLDLSNRKASLLPVNPLANATNYEIIVSSAILDRQNLPIAGTLTFPFKTALSTERPAGAQLVIYEPDANNVPPTVLNQLVGYDAAAGLSMVVATGSPGTADPEVPVILVNEATGVTATVLSKPDGSFANFINAAEEDFISATFVNANGTRIEVPATRQQFDDGRVGLYRGGGILEAQSDGGPVQVLIEPDTVKSRSVFKVASLGLPQLLALLNGTVPQNATMLPGVKIEVQGDKIEGESDISIPIDPGSLNLPPGTPPEDAVIALAVLRKIDGESVFEVVDKMSLEGGRISTHSPPFGGALGDSAGDLLLGADPTGLVGIICVPLLLGGGPVTVSGKTLQAPEFDGGNAIGNFFANALLQSQTAKPLAGAFIALNLPGQQTSLRGRLSPGIVYATSGPDGGYALVLPSSIRGYVLEATHPRFAEKLAEPVLPLLEFSAGGAVRKDLIFTKPATFDSNTPPQVTVGHNPYYPPAGGSTQVEINASHGGDTPDLIVSVDSVATLVPGVVVTPADVTISNVQEDEPRPKRKRWHGQVTCTKAAAVLLRITAHAEPGGVATTSLLKHRIDFRGAPPLVVDPLQPADTHDAVGPFVESVHPPRPDSSTRERK